ncbi:hypothetical protein RAH32_20950 [Paracoccus sp. WLY502]|uniref:hypothetical protein n=1 Tax=Paracoccus yibinensis TaxID=3068891 RepID=UPI002796B154|nr:hypothetical protein [Paracoccus sp. WLY502]MDQ1902884.1 hypothetical protein [Paracoccus sp. WLY502]
MLPPILTILENEILIKTLIQAVVITLLSIEPSASNDLNIRSFDEKINELTSALNEELSKNDRRLGDFLWSTEVQGEYFVWKAIRKSPDCRDKNFLEVERVGIINICSMEKDGSIIIRDFEGGDSLDFSYKSYPGLPAKIRTLSLDKSVKSTEEIVSMFTHHEAIAVSYEFCTGERTVSFYRNFSMRLSDADAVLSTLKKLTQVVCNVSRG